MLISNSAVLGDTRDLLLFDTIKWVFINGTFSLKHLNVKLGILDN